jgi:3-methylcrotonyl-CoA carboxylase alpha subunit
VREHDVLFPLPGLPPDDAFLLAALAEILRLRANAATSAAASADPHSPWYLTDAWRLNAEHARELTFRHGEQETTVAVVQRDGGFLLSLGGRAVVAHAELGDNQDIHADLAGRRVSGAVVAAGSRRDVFLDGARHDLAKVDPAAFGDESQDSSGGLVAPMPGKVVAWLVEPGAVVDKGAPLLVLEAMKMEHTILAPADGTVNGFHFKVGEQIVEGAQLVDFAKTE